MLRLKILQEHGGNYRLTKEFSSQVRSAMLDAVPNQLPWQEGAHENLEKFRVSVPVLESSARNKWSQILHFIVGSDQFAPPSGTVKKLLVSMGLLRQMSNVYARPEITNLGYHFMLNDIHDQLWLFIQHYTQQVEHPESVLQMLFKMSFCTPGTPCSTATLDQTQLGLLSDMSSFGLVYMNERSNRVFHPTSLGVNLVFGQSREEKAAAAAKAVDMGDDFVNNGTDNDKHKKVKSEGGKAAKGGDENDGVFIIAETNFKLYCYTSSSLHIQMIKLFSEPECLLPNLLVSVITRNSIREAFKFGITADQIIHFLEENAHPLCAKRHRPVPDNITDQIILWEGERNRVQHEPGVLYDKFTPEQMGLFKLCLNKAKSSGWLIFAVEEPPMIVVKPSSKDEMKRFISANKRS